MTTVIPPMMAHYSTGYPDVDAVLADLLAGVEAILGPQLVGLYLDGSLAIGDFSELSSDIDVLVVTENALPDDVVAALGVMHARLGAGATRWGNELEVAYIRRRALRRFDPDDNHHPCVERGSTEVYRERHEKDWIVHRYVIREHGIALVGPDPRTLIDPVGADDLRDAVVSILHGWWLPAPACRRVLENPFYRCYAVLTMCRILYTLEYGTVVSKPVAARWVQETLDGRWAPLIDAARSWSRDLAPDLDETLRFIEYTRQASER